MADAEIESEVPTENVNIVGPNGLGSVPPGQVQKYINSPFQKYRLATDEDVTQHLEKQKYESLPQRIGAGFEEAAKSGTFGISSGIETGLSKLGATSLAPEEQAKREQYNDPTLKFGESALGLVGSALIPGVGEANLLEKAGLAGSKAIGLGAEDAAATAYKLAIERGASKEAANIAKEAALAPFSTTAKIGSQAANMAVQTAGFQSGDEISKMFTNQQDPHTPLQTAATNIFLSGIMGSALGTGLGVVSPLWKNTAGPKVSQLLKGIQDRMGGVDAAIPDSIRDAAETSGIQISPEVKAALGDSPELRNKFQTLQESSTSSGLKAQESLQSFKKSAQDEMITQLGRTPEDVSNLGELSSYDSGKKIQDSLHAELTKEYAPLKEVFGNIENKFKDVEFGENERASLGEKIAKMVQEKSYDLSPSAPASKLIKETLSEIGNIKTLDNLKNYISIIGDKTKPPELWKVGGDLRNIFRDSEFERVTAEMGKNAPEMLTQHALARSAYADFMKTIDSLNDRLHVGRYGGPGSFLSALKEMTPEDVLRRTSGKNDADLLNLISQRFPGSAQTIKDYHVDSLLKQASHNAGEGNIISSQKLFSGLDKLSPEIKSFAFPNATPESLNNKFNSIRSLLDALPSKMNTSGTAKTLDSLWSKVTGTSLGFIAALTGHNPLLAFMMEPLSRWLSRDIPDAARLAMLRFAGSGQEMSATGFKAMADFVHHLKSGENTITRATKNLFKAGEVVLPDHLIPDQKSRDKLNAQIETLNQDNSKLMNIGGETQHYMPEQGAAMGQLAMNALQTLSALKPGTVQLNPLDEAIKPTKAEEATYNRALDMAEQPLLALKHMKEGTLIPQDVQILNQIYPDLKNRLTQKIMNEMTNHLSKDGKVPYKTRLGLSLFMGSPMDSTMTPEGIQAAQATFQQNISPTQPSPQARGGKAHSMKALAHISDIDRTPNQTRQLARSKI